MHFLLYSDVIPVAGAMPGVQHLLTNIGGAKERKLVSKFYKIADQVNTHTVVAEGSRMQSWKQAEHSDFEPKITLRFYLFRNKNTAQSLNCEVFLGLSSAPLTAYPMSLTGEPTSTDLVSPGPF